MHWNTNTLNEKILDARIKNKETN